MLKWQHFFPTAIVQRGRDYYKQNKVRSLIQDGDKYYAVVKGEKEYDVWMYRKDKGVPVTEAVQKEFVELRDKYGLDQFHFCFED